jgi:branched-chain amino acid aminotransferase
VKDLSLDILINGLPMPAQEPGVDMGTLLFASNGVYDTIRSYSGRPAFIDRHIARLNNSCRILGFDPPVSEGQWIAWATELLARNRLAEADARIRLSVLFGNPRSSGMPKCLVCAEPVRKEELDDLRASGRKATLAADRRVPRTAHYNAKTLSFAETARALTLSRKRGCDEVLFLNTSGEICEAAFANVCCVINGAVMTPPDDSPCLPGVTRDVLMEAAQRNGFQCRVQAIHLSELLQAEEVFTTSSISEIVPIVEIDGQVVGDGKPGPVTRRMQQLYRDALFY